MFMREYELYVPLLYNDGRPIEQEKLRQLKARLVSEFGGLTHFPQENEGLWKVGSFTFRDKIVIFRVLSIDLVKADQFFRRLKLEMKADWQQEDVLIIEREVKAI